jgi:tRNA-Thr(GGU) m(6)t(6)A37 methyltransferase TsaA
MSITVDPIGFVRGGRKEVADDNWGELRCTIELDERFPATTIAGLETFSHLVVIYQFHLVNPDDIELDLRYPRGNRAWPKVGVFAQRRKARPNRLGVSVCRIVKIVERRIEVQGLDAVDGSPVLDLKPYMTGFEPRGDVHEPGWARALMANYW